MDMTTNDVLGKVEEIKSKIAFYKPKLISERAWLERLRSDLKLSCEAKVLNLTKAKEIQSIADNIVDSLWKIGKYEQVIEELELIIKSIKR